MMDSSSTAISGDTLFTEELHVRAEILSVRDFLDSTDDIFRRSRAALELEESGRGGGDYAADTTLGEVDPLRQRRGGNSQSYCEAETRTVQLTLAEVERVANKRIAEGFNEANFTCGVLNLIVVVYVFGVYPEHFWLIYLSEGILLISAKFYSFVKAKPLNNALYFLDFCWVMNVIGVVCLLIFCIDGAVGRPLPEWFHRHLFAAALGVACGPLLGACLVLPFVCLLFHDVGTMADLFIHIFPPFLMYTLRWSADAIRASWPSVFYLNYMEDVHFFRVGGGWPLALGTVGGNTMVLYLAWFLCYGLWMLLFGMNLPRNDREGIVPKYDTVFHSLMRSGLCPLIGTKLWGRPQATSEKQVKTNHFEVRDLAVYMAAHLLVVSAGVFILGYLCFINQTLHGLFLILITLISTHKGSRRYTYYVTIMYGKMLRQRFSDVLEEKRGETA